MANNVYRTANGKMLDMRSLVLKNEKERAVGNMKVNARGDIIDDSNKVMVAKPQQVHKKYSQEVQLRKGNEG